MSRYAHLLSPFQLKNLTLRNRIISTAHAPGYAENGRPGEQYQAYHEEKAKGGLALTIFGGSANIARDSGSIYGQIYLGHDAIIPDFRAFSTRVKRHGAAIMCQISHMGRRTNWDTGDWLPTLAPSAQRDPAHGAMASEMTTHDIRRITQAFADAAWRCREGGLDGAEILAITHLLGQFLSPLVNHRKDAYGGNLENRARFLKEVLEAARERVGDDFVLGVRMVADESNEGGMSLEEGLELAALIGRWGLADYLNVNGAYGGTTPGLSEAYPTMGFPSAPYLSIAEQVRQVSGMVVMQAARIADPETADYAISAGHLDLVGLTRAHMADPYFVQKLQGGEAERIRPCVGAGYCIDRVYGGRPAHCLHNPATGRESFLRHNFTRAEKSLKVVIAGGGPAGLEAARVSALRGHQVTLFEAAEQLGGQLALTPRASWRKDLIGIRDWLAAEVALLPVDLRLGVYAEAEDLLALEPEVIILATGGLPLMDLPEGGGELAVSSWDVLAGQASVEGRILLYEDSGEHQGPATALALAEAAEAAGRPDKVEIATPHRMIGKALGGLTYPGHMKRLHRLGISVTPDHSLAGLRADGNGVIARFRNIYTREFHEEAYDHVVLEQGTLPDNSLYEILAPGSLNQGITDLEAWAEALPQQEYEASGYRLFRVGDAISSRNLQAAILDSLRLCQAL